MPEPIAVPGTPAPLASGPSRRPPGRIPYVNAALRALTASRGLRSTVRAGYWLPSRPTATGAISIRRLGARSPGPCPSLSVTLVIGITSRPIFDAALSDMLEL